MDEKEIILLLGGGSGCMAQIVADTLIDKCNLVVAGRTPIKDTFDFIKFNVLESNATKKVLDVIQTKKYKVKTIINCVSTGSKVSYDTTKIAHLNFMFINLVIHLTNELSANLIHISSLKVGNILSSSPNEIYDHRVYSGPRSPYAWSKLAAEFKLYNSNLNNFSIIQIGLIDSIKHAKKFYSRVPLCTNHKLKVTKVADFEEDLMASLDKTGRRIVRSKYNEEISYKFCKRMSNKKFMFTMPSFLYNFFLGRMMPHKGLDYISPGSETSYLLL